MENVFCNPSARTASEGLRTREVASEQPVSSVIISIRIRTFNAHAVPTIERRKEKRKKKKKNESIIQIILPNAERRNIAINEHPTGITSYGFLTTRITVL